MDLLIILKKQSMLILAPKFHHIFSYISLCYIEWIILICTMYNATKQFTVEWEQRPSRPVEQRYPFQNETLQGVAMCSGIHLYSSYFWRKNFGTMWNRYLLEVKVLP